MKLLRITILTIMIPFFLSCITEKSSKEITELKVGAFYYPWYGVERGAHTAIDHTFRTYLDPQQLPALGEYDSMDPEVISQHIEWSVQSGIDFWISSWWGPNGGEDKALKDHIMTHPNAHKLDYAILYESAGRLGSFENPDYTNLFTDMQYLKDNYFSDANYLRIDGKPVVYMYLTREYFKGDRADQLRLLKEQFPELYIIGDDLFVFINAAKSGYLDAVNNYDVYGQSVGGGKNGATKKEIKKLNRIYAAAKKKAKKYGYHFIPSVAPGYVDTGVRMEANHHPAPRYFNKESGSSYGDVFKAMIQDAAFPNLDENCGNIMLITSFNEWHEDSQIEPTAGTQPETTKDVSESGLDYGAGYKYEDYGTRYLDILKEITEGIRK